MDDDALARLRALAEEDPKLREALKAFPSWTEAGDYHELLARAALPRRFDRALYESVLVRGLAAPPTFDEFINLSEVERVPYTHDQFWIADHARRKYLQDWRDRTDRESWSQNLLAHFEKEPQASSFELLEQTVRCDPSRARKLFEKLYDEADAGIDLARCFALIQVLEASPAYLDTKLIETCRRYGALYRSRALFADELSRTVRYFRRVKAEQGFERVLAGEWGKWIFHLHGGGGLGKTTMLRWLIARRLVPRPNRVGCVRIDFDTVSVSAVTEIPWLVGIPIAAQLDPQLEHPIFESFRYSTAPFRRLLEPGPALDPETDEALRKSAQRSDYWSLLLQSFASFPPDKTVVVILDTLEEASLHRPGDLLVIVDQFSKLHNRVPQLRLVLSGRYALGLEHAPEYRQKYADATGYARLRRLSGSEAHAFVAAQACLPDDVVAAIVDRGAGNPFKLSLLIEFVGADETITAGRIRGPEFDDVDETYLIERVVRRIPAYDQLPVRWVVRYGVVPRRLTRAFVEDVLLPALARALEGEAHASGDDFIEEHLRTRAWPFRPGTQLYPEGIWQQLTAYSTAGGHGWLEVAHDKDTARFHPDVVNPMRRLLRRQPIFAELHRRALEHFSSRGAIADVLFHRLELDPEHLLDDVERALSEPALRQDPAAWRRLAEELLQRDFDPAPAAVRAFAHVQAAEAITAGADYGLLLDGRIFDDLSMHLETAHELEDETGRVITPVSLRVGTAAVRQFRAGDPEAAMKLVEALPHAVDPSNQTRLFLLLGDLRLRAGADGVEEAYESALESSARQPDFVIPPSVVHERLGNWHARRGGWEDAERHYHAALELAVSQSDSRRSSSLQRRLVELEVGTGRWQHALGRLSESAGDDDQWPRLRAAALLSLARPLEAGEVCSALIDRPVSPLSSAEARFLRGQAAEQERRLADCIADYSASRDAFASLGDLSGRDRCRTAELRMYVFHAGNLKEARICLEHRALETADRNPALRVQWELLSACVAARFGQITKARAIIADLARDDAPGQSAPQLALVLSAALALDLLPAKEAVPRLVSALSAIRPVAARLTLLEYLSVGRAWNGVSRAAAHKLEKLVPFHPEGGLERPIWALFRAELLRVIGRGTEAARLLSREVPAPSSSNPEGGVAFLARLQLERRLRKDLVVGQSRRHFWRKVSALFPSRDRSARPSVPSLECLAAMPMVRGAICVEAAEAALESGDHTGAEELTLKAAGVLERESFPTEYHARYCELAVAFGRVSREEAARAYARIGREGKSAQILRRSSKLLAERQRVVTIHRSESEYVVTGSRFKWESKHSTSLTELAEAAEQRSTSWLPAFIAENWLGFAQTAADLTAFITDPGSRRLWLDLPRELAPLPWEFMHGLRRDDSRHLMPIRCMLMEPPAQDETMGIIPWVARLLDLPADKSSVDLLLPERIAEARERLQSSKRSEPPRVLLMGEGTVGHAYYQLPRTLKSGGFYVAVYEDLSVRGVSPKPLMDAIRRAAPSVIYIISSLLDSSRSPDAILQAGRIEPKLLNLAIEEVTPRPVVVLDAPRAGAPAENVAQLLARNRFAFELFRRGNVAAVLATGLAEDEDLLALHERIVKALAAPRSQGDTLDDIAELCPGGLSGDPKSLTKAIPFLGTALFSNNPYDLLAPRAAGNA